MVNGFVDMQMEILQKKAIIITVKNKDNGLDGIGQMKNNLPVILIMVLK